MRKSLFSVVFLGLLAPVCRAQLSADQKIVDFQQLAALFAKRYAFVEWKRAAVQFDGMNLKPWIDRINQSQSDIEYFDISAQYVASYQDGHTGFILQSDFDASLGFSTDIYDGKVLIDYIDRKALAESAYPFQISDELVSIDNRTVASLMDELVRLHGDGNPRTARRFAALLLTRRIQSVIPEAFKVPNSSTVVVQRRSGATESYTIPWQKTGMAYQGVGPVPTPSMSARRSAAANISAAPDTPWPAYMNRTRQAQVLRTRNPRLMVGVDALKPAFAFPDSFTQRLGAGRYDLFTSGVFKLPGKNIGYIRLPDFMGFGLTAMQQEIRFMEANTDGLIVDVMRNPGGYGCTAESMAGFLAPDGIRSLGNSIRVTWDLILALESDLDTAGIYGATDAEIAEIQHELDASLAVFGKSRGMTEPLPICGTSLDVPHATDRTGSVVAYSKPIMLLVDDLSASAAELFAAILQDNQRAILYGYRTDGAGGSVSDYPVGIYSEAWSSIAVSILVRRSPVATTDFPSAPYIENIGVRPDKIDDYMTEDNLVNNGAGFVNRFLAAMVDYIQSGK